MLLLARRSTATSHARASVDFGELLLNEVSGKHKRGGLTLRPETVVARVSGACGSTVFSLRACVRAKLFEVNDRLTTSPELLRLAPSGAGFIAILQPFADAVATLQERCLTHEGYLAALAARSASALEVAPAVLAPAASTEPEAA